jgi:hypothetical protein
MRHLVPFLLFLCAFSASAQNNDWPRSFTTPEGYTITIFQPQAESLEGNLLKSRAAFSVLEPGKSDPYYGAMWGESKLLTNRDNRTYTLESLDLSRVRLPEVADEAKLQAIQTAVEQEVPKWELNGSLEDLLAAVEQNKGEQRQSDQLGTAPPKIFYADKPSMLVVIDGAPKTIDDKELGVQRVANSPNLIVKPSDGNFYLYGGGFWYQSSSATGPYTHIKKAPKSLSKAEKMIAEAEKEDKNAEQPKLSAPPEIVISTEPAEIIITEGNPEMATVEGTGLLYVKNTENELFMDVDAQQYYVLLSGRWYRSSSLQGSWTYVASDKLPTDFSLIPEGSEKDAVLANVAGTRAAVDAIMDAQVPQTAKVDRKNATANVVYDGQAQFETVENTQLQYAVNTSSSVIRDGNSYYTVENGVWFVSNSPNGPWQVATVRPQGIENTSPNSPVYNTKFVYIYDVTPEYIYMGYTPGYLGTYVYGPTIVYGTGFYYRPWYGSWYYPRPCTWGFNMNYNPWTGWSLGFSYGWGWYRPWGWGGYYGGYHGGCWGPPSYRPPYWQYHNHPHYGPRGPGVNINNNINVNHTNNIYNNRKDVVTKDRRPTPSARPSTKPGGQPGRQPGTNPTPKPAPRPSEPSTKPSTRPTAPGTKPTTPSTRPTTPSTRPGNIYSDREGNIYQKDANNGNWQTREQNQWKPAPSNKAQTMERDQMNQNRSNTRQQNFKGSNQGANMGKSYSRPSPSTGGSRPAPRPAPRGRG